jgi:type VI secretion system protein ImpM
MSRAAESHMLYFGKLPSRGDFVRSVHAAALTQVLDRWLSGGMELLAADARWKMLYDRAEPVQFAFLGSRHSRGLAGHLMVSQDASGRRFPFITATTFDSADPLPFLARSPMALARLWTLLDRNARQAHDAPDATPVLADWQEATLPAASEPGAYDASFDDFCEMQTVGTLQAMLTSSGHALNVRQLVLGLGLLLQPVMTSGETRLERGLLLPLPSEPLYAPVVAAFWLDLVAGFLSRASFELALFKPRVVDGQARYLALGFEGNSPRSLHALLDPEQLGDQYIDSRQAQWVEDLLGDDYAVNKLSSYLLQDGLSLRQAGLTFKEVFLGS